MLDKMLKDIQQYNAKANWNNLLSGVLLLVLLAAASLWAFNRNNSSLNTEDATNVSNTENTVVDSNTTDESKNTSNTTDSSTQNNPATKDAPKLTDTNTGSVNGTSTTKEDKKDSEPKAIGGQVVKSLPNTSSY